MRGRRLKGNKTNRAPSAHIAFDTETIPIPGECPQKESHAFRLGCAIYWRREAGRIKARKETTKLHPWELMDWIARRLSKHRTTWVWAHNLGFDLTTIRFWDWWDNGRFVPKFYCIDDPPVIVSGWIDGKRVVLLDTFNWFPCSLERIGNNLGCPKFDMPEFSQPISVWEPYCMRDTEIVELCVNKIIDTCQTLDLGCLRYTRAGQSMQHFRHLTGGGGIIPPNHPKEAELARGCYMGTQAAVFYDRPVKGPIYVLDVSGAHCSVMMMHKQPTRLIGYTNAPSMSALREYSYNDQAAATVLLATETPYPKRTNDLGTIFCVGRFTTELCGPELRRAVEQDVIESCSRLAIYETDYIMRDWASYWWQTRLAARESGDMLLEMLAKSMPCSLYGKWAQCRSGWEPFGTVDSYPRYSSFNWRTAHDCSWHPCRQIAGKAEIDLSRSLHIHPSKEPMVWRGPIKDVTGLEGPNYFPAISAWITSQVRCLMDDLRCIAGKENVYYQCHDSIHVSEEGYKCLEIAIDRQKNLCGTLKLERVLESAEYYGINLLRENGKLIASGLPGRHTEYSDGRLEATSFERLAMILSRWPDGTVKIWKHKWEPDYTYRHGVSTGTGWIDPIRLG